MVDCHTLLFHRRLWPGGMYDPRIELGNRNKCYESHYWRIYYDRNNSSECLRIGTLDKKKVRELFDGISQYYLYSL